MSRSRLSLRGTVFITALMLSGGSAFGANAMTSANDVMPGCRDSLKPEITADFLQGFCLGLITALSDVADATKISCLPPEVTRGQIVRVVVQYIDNRPARMHEIFTVFAAEAMKSAWPCQR